MMNRCHSRNRHKLKAITCLLLGFLTFTCTAQVKVRLTVSPAEWQTVQQILNTKDFEGIIWTDSILNTGKPLLPQHQAALRAITDRLHQQSRLAANIESAYGIDSNTVAAQLYVGPQFTWATLHAPEVHREWFLAAGFQSKKWIGQPLRYDILLKMEQKLLETAENNGYPFASVWLDSIQIDSAGRVNAALQLRTNQYITFGGINLRGNVKLPKGFMAQYLGIKTGAPYRNAQVLRLREQLRALPYLETDGNPGIRFTGNQAFVNLPLKPKKAGRFDFIIGLLPQSNTPDARLLLTGSLDALFLNALNQGERLSLNFERLKPETQRLDVAANVPYIVGSPFGVDTKLHIYRRDSTWVDAQSSIGLQYLFAGADAVQFFWENRSSFLQKINTNAILTSKKLPGNLDYRQNSVGIEAQWTRLDYRYNPRKGWFLLARAGAGYNIVQKNSQIEALVDPAQPEFKFAGLYDTVTLRSTRIRPELRMEGYIPMFRRSTLLLRFRGAGIFSSQPVLQNEQYRLGGNKLLRGFNEESLFATRWAVSTVELRLLTSQNAYLSVFSDYGYIENITRQTRTFSRPWGLGVGMNLETKGGIFGIQIAAGQRDTGDGFDFQAVKFHLGYVSLF